MATSKDKRFVTRQELNVWLQLLNERDQAAKKAVEVGLASAEKAVIKAETATERRFESVNEFRAQLADQSREFMPRAEYAANHSALQKQVDELSGAIRRAEGQDKGTVAQRAASYATIGIIGTIILVGIAVLAFVR